MYYSYVEIEYVATSFSPARMDLALKLLRGWLCGMETWLGIPILLPISGTPIVSGIPILFSIPKIPVGKYFLNSDVWRVRKLEFRFQNL
jgi:hypothetical protein